MFCFVFDKRDPMFTNELLIKQYNLVVTKKDLNSFPGQEKKFVSLYPFIKVISVLFHNGCIVQEEGVK